MSAIWALQDAKARFSELFNRVRSEGPQRVTKRGKETIVLLSETEYERLSGDKPSFVDFLLSGPKGELSVDRARDFGRAVEL